MRGIAGSLAAALIAACTFGDLDGLSGGATPIVVGPDASSPANDAGPRIIEAADAAPGPFCAGKSPPACFDFDEGPVDPSFLAFNGGGTASIDSSTATSAPASAGFQSPTQNNSAILRVNLAKQYDHLALSFRVRLDRAGPSVDYAAINLHYTMQGYCGLILSLRNTSQLSIYEFCLDTDGTTKTVDVHHPLGTYDGSADWLSVALTIESDQTFGVTIADGATMIASLQAALQDDFQSGQAVMHCGVDGGNPMAGAQVNVDDVLFDYR